MKKILILSSTLNSNLDMSNQIKNFLDTKDNITSEVISLEQFDLPLYTPSLEEKFKSNNSFPESIEKAKNVLIDSEAIIWCSPEYNGGISPIVTNTIAWISRATEDWREAFNKKNVLICSSSGGNGKNFLKGFKIQLNYLGSMVTDGFIKTKKQDVEKEFFKKVLLDFYNKVIN